MSTTTGLALVTGAVTDFGTGVLAVLTATLVLTVGYMVFRFGLARLMYDQSLCIGGFYIRRTPWKGYNRFRTRKWNYTNTLES